MIDSILRPLKDRLFAPLLPALGRIAGPDAVSIASFLVGISCAVAVYLSGSSSVPILAFLLWLLNRILDGLDGALARATSSATDRGGYLDIILDFLVYASVPLAMVFSSTDIRLAQAGAVLLAAFYINSASWMYLSAVFEKRNFQESRVGEDMKKGKTSVVMPPGIVEGTETIVLYSLMILFTSLRLQLFLVCTGLTFFSAMIRFMQGLRILRNR